MEKLNEMEELQNLLILYDDAFNRLEDTKEALLNTYKRLLSDGKENKELLDYMYMNINWLEESFEAILDTGKMVTNKLIERDNKFVEIAMSMMESDPEILKCYPEFKTKLLKALPKFKIEKH